MRIWVVLLIAIAAAQANSGEEHLRIAAQQAGAGNVPAAMAEARAALAMDAADAQAWYQLGSLLGQTGNFVEAETALRRAIQVQPAHARAHYTLALTLVGNPQNKQDWPGAIAECRQALKLQPAYPEALSLLGAGLNNTGQADAAVEALERAIALSPSLAEAHFNLGLALEGKAAAQSADAGKTRHQALLNQAASEYRAAVAARGVYPEASSALGKLLFSEGESAPAEEAVRAALRANPDLADAHYLLARILRSSQRSADASVEFAEAKALTERPADGVQSAHLSNTALQAASAGNLSGAAAMLRNAITLKPDYGVPHYNLGLLLADSGDLAGARAELIKAISLMPGQARPWYDYGRVAERAKDNAAALQAITWAAYLSPKDATIGAELSSLHGANPGLAAPPIGHPPEAGAANDTSADHFAFGVLLKERGDFGGAAGEFLRSLALDPGRVDARRELARAYQRMEETDRAILEYRKILLVSPEIAEANGSLGELLLAGGEPEQALRYLRLALQSKPDSTEYKAAVAKAMKSIPPTRSLPR